MQQDEEALAGKHRPLNEHMLAMPVIRFVANEAKYTPSFLSFLLKLHNFSLVDMRGCAYALHGNKAVRGGTARRLTVTSRCRGRALLPH